MDILIFNERKSKAETLHKNISIINNELTVRKPHISAKTVFNGIIPKNRKNLKKLNVMNIEVKKNEIKKSTVRPPSIQSLITNSKTDEFLSLDKPNNFGQKLLPLMNFSSSSTLYSIKSNNNFQRQSSNQNNILYPLKMNSDNNIRLTNSVNNLPIMNTKKISENSIKSKSSMNIKPGKDINQLYQEFTSNVIKYILYNII